MSHDTAVFCGDPTPQAYERRSACIREPGHNVGAAVVSAHMDRDGNRWIVSQSTIDEAERIQRRADERSRQDLLRRDLRDKYVTAGMPEAVSDRLFEVAWEHGHSSGDHEVEMFYESIKDVVNAAFRAGRAAGRIEVAARH
jgi:hypothetical protein